jgi:hypothetical protein
MPRRLALAAVFAALLATPVFAQDSTEKRFTATAEMTTSQGTRRLPLTVIVGRPLTKDEARPLRQTLEHGGQQALLTAIRGGNRGRLNLGNLEVPLDLVVFEPLSDGGTRYVVVTTRSLKIDEVNESAPSLDYPFAVAIFDVPDFGAGQGQLFPRASLSIQENGRILLEHYDDEPGQLKDVRRQD